MMTRYPRPYPEIPVSPTVSDATWERVERAAAARDIARYTDFAPEEPAYLASQRRAELARRRAECVESACPECGGVMRHHPDDVPDPACFLCLHSVVVGAVRGEAA